MKMAANGRGLELRAGETAVRVSAPGRRLNHCALGRGEWRRVQLRTKAPHEASYLKLDSGKSRTLLGWRPLLDAG